jgi:5-(carboxyamino)imidazole ribonucleotide synthase
MLNWVGELPSAEAVLREGDAHWHDYGKEPRAGRKVGHATICARTPAEMRERLIRLGHSLGREPQVTPVLNALQS